MQSVYEWWIEYIKKRKQTIIGIICMYVYIYVGIRMYLCSSILIVCGRWYWIIQNADVELIFMHTCALNAVYTTCTSPIVTNCGGISLNSPYLFCEFNAANEIKIKREKNI